MSKVSMGEFRRSEGYVVSNHTGVPSFIFDNKIDKESLNLIGRDDILYCQLSCVCAHYLLC